MIISCSWISLPCLSSSVIIRFFPRLCVLLTFYKLLDASIVSRISSKLCFRMSSLAFFFTVLHISTYSMWSLGVLFSIIPRGYSCYVVFRFLVYEEAYTCLSIVGLRVVQQVATLESCETFLFSSDFSEPYHVPFHVVFFQFFFQFMHVFIF